MSNRTKVVEKIDDFCSWWTIRVSPISLKGTLGERHPWLARTLAGFSCSPKPKIRTSTRDFLIFGGRSGTRTLGPLIKSQLLYQLS